MNCVGLVCGNIIFKFNQQFAPSDADIITEGCVALHKRKKTNIEKKHRYGMQYFGLQLTKGHPIVLEWSKFKSKSQIV